MNKRIIAGVLAVVFMLSCCGCSGAWRRKFVRKKKGEVKEGPVLHPEEYRKEFTNKQFYANHFAFWKAAESEFINSLKGDRSAGRINTYASYAIDELKSLHKLLAEEKQKELYPFIEELREITAKMDSPTYMNSRRNFLVEISSKHYRAVSRRFSFYSMKNYIIPEERAGKLAEPGPTEPELEAIEESIEGSIEDSRLEATSDDEAMPQETEGIGEPEELTQPGEMPEEIAEELEEPKPQEAESGEPGLETEEP